MQESIFDTLLPIPEHRKPVYEYYRLDFDEEGCPMQRIEKHGMIFHPLLPAYLIMEYINMFIRTGHIDTRYIEHADVIISKAIKRAEEIQDTLIFYYHPNTGISEIPSKFYSALTQAWYIYACTNLSHYYPDRYNDSLRRFFRSLQVPVQDGGVLVKKDWGWIMEEYPHNPTLYTLNGWLTALQMLLSSGDALLRVMPVAEYTEFVERNLDAAEKLLHFYDAPDCLNSRYKLAGFSRIKLVFDSLVKPDCNSFQLHILGEPDADCFCDLEKRSRWINHLERREDRLLQFNVVLSLISKPHPNIFRASLRMNQQSLVKIYLAQGDYRPDVTAMPTTTWKLLQTVALAEGPEVNMECEIPFDGKDLFAYPTNWKKRIGATFYNAYHFVHIMDVVKIYQYTRRHIFRETALRWLAYYENWSSLPYLQADDFSRYPHAYGKSFSSMIHSMLLNPKKIWHGEHENVLNNSLGQMPV
jgi:hypothetical protein